MNISEQPMTDQRFYSFMGKKNRAQKARKTERVSKNNVNPLVIPMSSAELLVFMNKDLEVINVTPEWLRKTEEKTSSGRNCGVVLAGNFQHSVGRGKMSNGMRSYEETEKSINLRNTRLGDKKRPRPAKPGELIVNPLWGKMFHKYGWDGVENISYYVVAQGGEDVPVKERTRNIGSHGKRGRDRYKKQLRLKGIARKRDQNNKPIRKREYQGTEPNMRLKNRWVAEEQSFFYDLIGQLKDDEKQEQLFQSESEAFYNEMSRAQLSALENKYFSIIFKKNHLHF